MSDYDDLTAKIARPSSLLTIDAITRESVRLFRNSNWFLRQQDEIWSRFYEWHIRAWLNHEVERNVGRLRIRLPNDYALTVSD